MLDDGSVDGGAPSGEIIDAAGFFGEEKGMEIVYTQGYRARKDSALYCEGARMERNNDKKKQDIENKRLQADSLKNTITQLGGADILHDAGGRVKAMRRRSIQMVVDTVKGPQADTAFSASLVGECNNFEWVVFAFP